MSWIEGAPNPGSDSALKRGCTCPVLDNNHGRRAPWPARCDTPEGWWTTTGCPLHSPGGPDAAA